MRSAPVRIFYLCPSVSICGLNSLDCSDGTTILRAPPKSEWFVLRMDTDKRPTPRLTSSVSVSIWVHLWLVLFPRLRICAAGGETGGVNYRAISPARAAAVSPLLLISAEYPSAMVTQVVQPTQSPNPIQVVIDPSSTHGYYPAPRSGSLSRGPDSQWPCDCKSPAKTDFATTSPVSFPLFPASGNSGAPVSGLKTLLRSLQISHSVRGSRADRRFLRHTLARGESDSQSVPSASRFRFRRRSRKPGSRIVKRCTSCAANARSCRGARRSAPNGW